MPKKTRAKSAATNTHPVKLTAFHDNSLGDDFGFSRFNWERPGPLRESILPRFEAKARPGSGDAEQSHAAASEILLPDDASDDYFRMALLVRRYEEALPPHETIAYAQVTLRFPDAANLHHPFEVGRQWAKAYFVDGRRLPAVLFLHDPALIGSENAGHLHILVLPRRLTRRGWAGMDRIGNDAFRAQARDDWAESYEKILGRK